MARAFRNLDRLYRRLGFKRFAVRIARRLGSIFYAKRAELVLVKRLDRVPERADDLDLQPITAHHAALLARFNETHRGKAKARAATWYVSHGYRGYLAFVGGTPIGYLWWVDNTTDSAVTHPNVERFDLALGDDEAFAFDYFVAPQHRSRGTALKFLLDIYAALAKDGYSAVWGSVDAENVGARWVYRTSGSTIVRQQISREVCSRVLIQDARVFVRNTRWSAKHPFERRLLFSLRADSPGESHAAVAPATPAVR